MESLFENAIREHLELKHGNAPRGVMPVESYRGLPVVAPAWASRGNGESEGAREAADRWLSQKPLSFDWGGK